MIVKLTVVCCGAFTTLLACGGESSSPNGASAGSGTGSETAGTSAASGGSAGAASQGGASATAGAGGTAGSSALGGTGAVPDMSDPGSGTCTAFTPCGGSITGTWQINSICLSPALIVPFNGCATAREDLLGSGSITFGADRTVDVTQVHLGASLVFPPSCITDAAACTALSATYGPCSSTPDGGCRCTPADTTTSAPPMETYSVAGNSLIINVAGKAPQTAYYCITGNQLLMRGRTTSTGTLLGNSAFVYSMTRKP